MVEVKAVIGKNFGDEGKGQTVDRLCRGKNALVVRNNGGAQAGHTVWDGDFRFVFHQLGSGSYRGCPTFWGRSFLPDLLKLGEEVEAFRQLSSFNTVYADPNCACTTVYDVLINSLTEQLRGADKHGSCGMGIFEAVLRTGKKPYALYLYDFMNSSEKEILEKLRNIRDRYSKVRLAELRTEYPGQFDRPEIRKWISLIYDENLLYNTVEIMRENFRKYVTLAEWRHMAGQYHTIVFENGQGLLLDWDNEEYAPHLTASYTGLKNVAELLEELNDSEADFTAFSLEIIYVSRTYVTRHGAGRLDYECTKEEINPEMEDCTNVPNPWQDALRYAKHPSGEEFFRYIRKDLNYLNLPFFVTFYLTHCDETQGKILFWDKSRSLGEFCKYCSEQAPGLIQNIYADEQQGKEEP